MSQTTTYAGSAGTAKSEIETSTIRTISWRLIPFLVLAYFFSYLDRVNLGFAALTMNTMSLDLHRITLGALIIALGLLVDDAIIAVEMMVVKMEQGWDRMQRKVHSRCSASVHGGWVGSRSVNCQFG